MISHIFIGVNDFGLGFAFYSSLMEALHNEPFIIEKDRHWAVWRDTDRLRPLFMIGRPENGARATAGNGQMTAFLAPDRATVDAAHAAALKHGGQDEGAPGLRPHYHENYYGAYFRDPEGNKLCAVCHRAE